MLKRTLPLMLLIVAAAVVTQTVAGELVIHSASPPCGPGKVGFGGSFTRAGVTVKFWTCVTPETTICHSTFTTGTDDPISEVDNTGDSLRMYLAGVEITDDPLTEEQQAAMDAMFFSPEAALAEDIWEAFDALGMTIGSGGAVECLWVHSDLWEKDSAQYQGASNNCPDCNDHSKGCPGCCGREGKVCKSTGCQGTCTNECLDHDEMCGSSFMVHRYLQSCRQLLKLATISHFDCKNRKDNCGGKGQDPCVCCT